MPVQAIAWTPSGAVRIVDQRALPEAHIERDLESVAAMAEAIRTLQVRGAPLIGIAAAMGLVAGLRDERGAPRERFLARVEELAAPLAAARPTAVNLRWALDRMRRVAAQAPGDGAALWDRLKSEATAIWEEDRAMCRRIGEAGLALVRDTEGRRDDLRLLQRLTRRRERDAEDLLRVVLHLAGRRKVLGELTVAPPQHAAVLRNDERSGAGRSLIEPQHRAHGSAPKGGFTMPRSMR